MKVFDKHQKKEHVVDMMTVVNLAVAEMRERMFLNTTEEFMAAQVPSMVSSLRKRFYLYNSKSIKQD